MTPHHNIHHPSSIIQRDYTFLAAWAMFALWVNFARAYIHCHIGVANNIAPSVFNVTRNDHIASGAVVNIISHAFRHQIGPGDLQILN